MTDQEPLDCTAAERQTLPCKLVAQFLDRDIRHSIKRPRDRLCMRFDTGRTPIATRRAGAGVALSLRKTSPTAHTGSAHTRSLGHNPVPSSVSNRGEDTRSKIQRKSF